MINTRENAEAMNNTTSFSDLKRSAGILLHITSLPSSYGIGDIGPGAKTFADFLHRSHQTFWQLLPVNPTTKSNGYSPYSSTSAMAGNPLFISPDILIAESLLTEKEVAPYKVKGEEKVNFKKVEKGKYAILELAYNNYNSTDSSLHQEFKAYCYKEAYWLHDFALFSVLQQENNNSPWHEWDEPFKQRDSDALEQFAIENKEAIRKRKWQQYIFARQWQALKIYCDELNIRLLGDMPIYVAYNSVDVWSNQEIFSLNKEGKQLFIAGTPPDEFNENGQLWGMPVFNWNALKNRNYDWWITRLKRNLEFFHFLRLDHFRAFSAYWQIKAGAKSALEGEWIGAPGKELFTRVQQELGHMPFIAEDLGDISNDVYQLRDDFGLPGMEVLTFAFDEEMKANVHIPYNHIPLCVVYTGTHDTDTILGWFASLSKGSKKNLFDYTGIKVTEKNVCDLLARMAYSSVSKLAVLPLQDILELGTEARMNTPSAGKNNWAWRVKTKQMNAAIQEKLNQWCIIYDRKPGKI